METKDGDRVVALSRLINLQELVKQKEQIAKELRYAIWEQEHKLEQGY